MRTEAQQQIAMEALDKLNELTDCNLYRTDCGPLALEIILSAIERAMVHRCPDCGSWITRPTAQRKGDAAQPQRSEQQDFNASDIDLAHKLYSLFVLDLDAQIPKSKTGKVETVLRQAARVIHVALAAECQRREQAESVSAMWNNKFNESQKQLLSAQAAVEKQTEALDKCLLETRDNARLQNIIATALSVSVANDSALREHDAEVRKPLVEALEELIAVESRHSTREATDKARRHAHKLANVALDQCKEA